MKILSASFVVSAARPDQFPTDGRPEVAFVGRSNVGKSSLLNKLVNRHGLAKTSQTPGKTQLINFFDLNGQIYLVDLPGYGYAKVAQSMRQEWGQLIADYLTDRSALRRVFSLIDARHEPTVLDRQMIEWLTVRGIPFTIVLTKTDKLSNNELHNALRRLRVVGVLPDVPVIPFSAVKGTGRSEVLRDVQEAIVSAPREMP